MGLYEQSKITRLKNQPLLKTNILHQFASYTTIFTLSGLSEKEFTSQDFLTKPVHDIIARTGGIGGDAKVSTRLFSGDTTENRSSTIATRANEAEFKRDYTDSIQVLARAHDLFIENVNITSTTSPNLERGLGNFTKMEFEISEPYGITLIEKIRAACGINGYKDYQDAPLLLTIEFKGFDENGLPVKRRPMVRKIPIGITRVDFDVNEGGARYTLLSVPYPEMAYDDRYKFPRTDVPVATSTPEDWAAKVEQVLNVTMMDNEIKEKKRQLKDTYKFIIDDEVLKNGKKYASNETNATIVANTELAEFYDQDIEAGTSMEADIKTIEGTASQKTSLTKFFEDAIRSLTGYKDLAQNFWVSYLRNVGIPQGTLDNEEELAKLVNSDAMASIVMANQYVNWFKIKTTVETPDPSVIDNITRMSPKIITYRAIPYKIHVLKLIRPGISISGVDWKNLVHKDYNYIYTGSNLDVQNLRINYKTAYYMRNVRGNDKGVAERGIFNWLPNTAKRVFGLEDEYPEPLKPLRQYPSTTKGRSVLQKAGGDPRDQEFYDYLTNPEADMLRIEMDILGDPAYICQDAYLPISKTRGESRSANFATTYNSDFDCFNTDAFQPLLNLNYRLPDEVDVKEGTMFSGTTYRDENLFFNGIYQVNKIESKFDQGQFTQTLFCTRFNNQQGYGVTPLTASVNESTGNIIDTLKDIEQDKKQTIREIREQIKKDERGDIDDLDGRIMGLD